MRGLRRVLVVALVGVLSVGSSGCSFLFMRSAPSEVPRGKYVSCDDGYTYPILDLILAATYASMAYGVATGDSESGTTSESNGSSGVISALVLVALWGGSSWYGFSNAGRCSTQHADFRAWQTENPMPVEEERPVWNVPAGRVGTAYPGREANICRADHSCDPGLVCASNICVVPPSGAAIPPPVHDQPAPGQPAPGQPAAGPGQPQPAPVPPPPYEPGGPRKP